jgi:hypothetical protein
MINQSGRVTSREFLRGYQGVTGMDGLPGPAGVPGIVGPQGNTGLQGIVGVQGAIGPQGNTGHQGATGVGVRTQSSNESSTTPLALSSAGSALMDARSGHTHQSPGGIVNVIAQASAGPSNNAENTLLTVTLPANFLQVGTMFRFVCQGTYQSQATSGTLIFRMYIGANAGQTIQLSSQSSAVAQSPMRFEGYTTIRTTGSNGSYISTGVFEIINGGTTRINYGQGGSSTTVVDTTVPAPVVKLTAQWATSSSTNILNVQNGFIEVIKM